MKGILLEKNKYHGLFITKDGAFVKGRHQNREVGEEFDVQKVHYQYLKLASVAALIIMMLVVGIPYRAFAEPYGYASVDINPSVEFGFNESMKIIKVTPLNQEGEELLSLINPKLKGMKLDEGINQIINYARQMDYDTEDVVLTYTRTNNEANQSVDQEIENMLLGIKGDKEHITVLDVDKEVYKAYKDKPQPPAYNVIKSKLIEMKVDESAYEDIEKVSELAHIMVQAKKAEKDAEKEIKQQEKEENQNKNKGQETQNQEQEKETNDSGEENGNQNNPNELTPQNGSEGDNGQEEQEDGDSGSENQGGSNGGSDGSQSGSGGRH
jgi:hypothetical protein